jgi:hypothetical protein
MYVCRYYRLSCSQSKTQTGQVKTTTSAGLVLLLLLLLLLSDTYTWKYENVLKGTSTSSTLRTLSLPFERKFHQSTLRNKFHFCGERRRQKGFAFWGDHHFFLNPNTSIPQK